MLCFVESSLEMIVKSTERVICRDSVVSEKSGKCIHDESRVQLQENFQNKHFALLAGDDSKLIEERRDMRTLFLQSHQLSQEPNL